MRGFGSILKREFNAYFTSPVAYVVIGIFMILSSLMFFFNVQWYYNASYSMFQNPYNAQSLNLIEDFLRPLFANLSVILLFIVPVITMRCFAEEKKSGTFELLLTYPVSDTSIILGKFAAAIMFFLVMMILTLFFPIYLMVVSDPEIGPILSSYLGFFLLGATFIAMGVFVSSTTENQIISALGAFGLNLILWIVGWVNPTTEGISNKVFQYLSIIEHFDPMTQGILNTKDIVYFLSMIFIFIFLTNRVLMSKKWRG